MSTDELGTARLTLGVNIEPFSGEMARARGLAAGFGKDVEEAFNRSDSKVKAASKSLLTYTALIGKSAEEQKLMRADWAGVSKVLIDDARARLDAYNNTLRVTAENTAALAAQQREASTFKVALVEAADNSAKERASLAAAAATERATIDANNAMREQQRVVAALTAQFDALAIAEQRAASEAKQDAQFSQYIAGAEQARVYEQAVRGVGNALELQAEKERQLASQSGYEKELAAANQARRRADAVAALTVALEREEAAEARLGSQGTFIASLERQSAAIGKTRADLLEMQAAELGVEKRAAPMIAALRAQEQALVGVGTQFNKYGLSVKQTAAAMRGVPAQVTDIFVSLQGGQNPLTVLLQQGGQLKDMFGGIAPAANALAQGLLKLVNPYTVLAAAIGGVIALQVVGERQTNAFNSALILSGNVAGQSAEQLQSLADSLDNMAGVTSRGAAAALTEVIATGRIAAESQRTVTEAALAMQNATGRAVKDTVAEFVELGRDPVAAILKLNETQHFLTRYTLDQIQAFVDQGDAAAASALATTTWADTTKERAAQVVQSMGLVTGAWHGIKDASGEALDGTIGFFSRLDHDAKSAILNMGGLRRAMLATIPGGLNAEPFIIGALGTAGIPAPRAPLINLVESKAAADFQALKISNLSKEQKLEIEINKIKATGSIARVSDLEIEKQVAAARARYAESLPKPKKDRSGAGIANAQSGADLQAFKDQLTVEQNAISNSTKLLQANYNAKLVSQEDYYAQSRALMVRDTKAQETAILGQIASLNSRNAAGKDSINVQKQLGTLEAQLAKVRADSTTAIEVLAIAEKKAVTERTRAIEDYGIALDLSNAALEQSVNAAIRKIGMGDQEYAQQEKLTEAKQRYAEEVAKLQLLKARDGVDTAVVDAELAQLKVAFDARISIIQGGYAAMLSANSNWLNGVSTAITNWMDQTANVAAQTEAMVSKGMDTLVNGLAGAAETGKLEWRSMLIDMLRELEKFLIKQALLKAAYSFVDSFTFGGVASGGVYDNSPSLSAYSGGIYNHPTPFKFAKGAGVFGEAGPEAIMPLSRGSDGKLGVTVGGLGGAGGSTVIVNVNTTVNGDGSSKTNSDASGDAAAYKQFAVEMGNIAEERIQRSMRPGGTLWRAGVNA